MTRPGLGDAILLLFAFVAVANVAVFGAGFLLEQARHRYRARRLRRRLRATIELRHGRLVERTYAQDRLRHLRNQPDRRLDP